MSQRFDGQDPALLASPYATYERLRDEGGLARGGLGQWVVSRHDDVAALLRDRRLSKSFPESYLRIAMSDPDVSSFLARQNVGRRDQRAAQVLSEAFGPALAELTPGMRRLAAELLEPAVARGGLEVVGELAMPFATTVMCDLIGVPERDRAEVLPRVVDLVDAFSDAAFLSGEGSDRAGRALRWLRAYLGGLLAARREAPRADLLTRVLEAPLGDEELADTIVMVFYAGFETSVAMISNGIEALARDPRQYARLGAERALVPRAVEEFLRHEAPIQVTTRVALEPLEVCGRTVRRGRVVLLLLGSANRDGCRFPEPDRLDVARDPNPHVSFGGGRYHCVGAGLARAEGRVVLEALLDRFQALALHGDPVRRPRFNFRSHERLELTVTPR